MIDSEKNSIMKIESEVELEMEVVQKERCYEIEKKRTRKLFGRKDEVIIK